MSSKKSKTPKREIDGYPILSVPTVWWGIMGLWDGGWSELHQARNQDEAKRYLAIVLDSEDVEYVDFEDFAILAPELEHSISPTARGQHRAWLESIMPATAAARAAAGRTGRVAGVRGRAARRGSTASAA